MDDAIRSLCIFLAGWTLISSGTHATAHPLKAAPPDHPIVFAFEQFFLPEDDDAYLTQGGLLLLAELRCTACHSPPADWQDLLLPAAAPDLSNVAERLDMDAIWRFVRHPYHRKPGSTMPNLFTADHPQTAEHIEALATYLHSLAKRSNQQLPAANRESGRQLYHETGCVACHQPASDYQPPYIQADPPPEDPALTSIPIALAEDYPFPALTSLLLGPHHKHLHGFSLNEQKAAHIAAYLQDHDSDPADPPQKKSLNLRALLKIPAQPAELGKSLFSTYRCHSCHQPNHRPTAHAIQQFAISHFTGCLSNASHTGRPNFHLSPLQQKALHLAIQHLQQHPQPTLSTSQQQDLLLARHNCYACHDYQSKGSPEIARQPYFKKLAPSLRLPKDSIAPPSCKATNPH